jgi:hypothetical protein
MAGGPTMIENEATAILQTSIDVHGGMKYWNALEAIEADISANGFLFTAKHCTPLNHVRMRASVKEAKFSFLDFPKPGQTAELIGNEEVRILDQSGIVIARRERPRAAFRGIRHFFFWDALDFIYFGGYATWNYLTTPFLLMQDGFKHDLLGPFHAGGRSLTKIQVTFPEHVPTHSRRQVFYFDNEKLLRRIDYTAEVVGIWAHAAHLCEEYKTFGGLKVPTRRRVYPLFSRSKPYPLPLLVAIDVHNLSPIVAR